MQSQIVLGMISRIKTTRHASEKKEIPTQLLSLLTKTRDDLKLAETTQKLPETIHIIVFFT